MTPEGFVAKEKLLRFDEWSDVLLSAEFEGYTNKMAPKMREIFYMKVEGYEPEEIQKLCKIKASTLNQYCIDIKHIFRHGYARVKDDPTHLRHRADALLRATRRKKRAARDEQREQDGPFFPEL